MSKKRPDSTCQHCGKSYHPKGTGRVTYCSRECYFASGKIGRWKLKKELPKKIWYCKVCNKPIESYHAYCSDKCRKEKERIRSLKHNQIKMLNKTTKERFCKECNKAFKAEYGDKRTDFCSLFCSKKYSRRIRKPMERARLKKVKVDNVDPMKVFNRDGWRCQLCHKKLKKADRGTFKDVAPELDHIIPLSKGGEHSYRNTQCACRKCNSEKGGQEIGQIRMFG